MRIALQRIKDRLRRSVPGESATGQLRRGFAGAPTEAKFARKRFAGAADRETIGGGKVAYRSGGQHCRLLLHRPAIASSAPAYRVGDLPGFDDILDGDSSIVRVVIVGVVLVMPLDRRRWLSIRRYRRRLLAASSCFHHERRGDDADAR